MSNPTFREGICVYCGKFGEVTADHIIPQCLWSGRVPKDAPVIDACPICNSVIKSGNDTYFRDILLTDMHSSKSPIAQKILPRFERSINRNQSRLANDMKQNEVLEIQTPSGLFVRSVRTSSQVNAKIMPILKTMIRGLYYYSTGDVLSGNVPIEGDRNFDKEQLRKLLNHLIKEHGKYTKIQYGKVGDGEVFEYSFTPIQGLRYTSVWILNFYRRMRFVFFINFPENNKRR